VRKEAAAMAVMAFVALFGLAVYSVLCGAEIEDILVALVCAAIVIVLTYQALFGVEESDA
jgi:hypothetical protein